VAAPSDRHHGKAAAPRLLSAPANRRGAQVECWKNTSASLLKLPGDATFLAETLRYMTGATRSGDTVYTVLDGGKPAALFCARSIAEGAHPIAIEGRSTVQLPPRALFLYGFTRVTEAATSALVRWCESMTSPVFVLTWDHAQAETLQRAGFLDTDACRFD
jgi:hypothetical protein